MRRIIGSVKHNGVCVIGAGVSGLVSIRYLLKDGMDVVAIEAKDKIGGTWHSVDIKANENSTLKQMYGHYLPEIYDGLNTNIEQTCMTLKDMPYDKNHVIVPGSEYLSYLHQYVKKFNLQEHIIFNHVISKIRLIANLTSEEIKDYGITQEESKYRYIIVYEKNKKGEHVGISCGQNYIFCDFVISSNGLYNLPFIPDTPGRHLFVGEEIHTNSYVTMSYLRSNLEGKRVIVVGSNQSGRDIVSHCLSGYNGEPPVNVVHVTHSVGSDKYLDAGHKAKESHEELKDKLTIIKGRLSEFVGKNKAIIGGKEVDVDVVVWATGYAFAFPFLDPKDKIIEVEQTETNGRLILPLYLMTFSINEPSFSRPLVPYKYKVELLCNVERQIIMISAVYSGKVKLPSKEYMMKDLEEHIQKLRDNGYDLTWFHKEVPGISSQSDLLDKWFKYSGIAERDFGLDKLNEDINKMKLDALVSGDFYHYPQNSHFNVEYSEPFTSNKF